MQFQGKVHCPRMLINSDYLVSMFSSLVAVAMFCGPIVAKSPASQDANSAASTSGSARFTVEDKPDRLAISLAGRLVAEYVFLDRQILRPYFAQVRTPGGLQVTRSHPPVQGVDATDHDTIHPGIWLGFGDLSGHDFWRNKGRVEHVRFVEPPTAMDDRLTFATESRLMTTNGTELCRLVSRFVLRTRPTGWMLVWDATFRSESADFSFGDKEEMGFGARVATPLTEKNGGLITTSTGQRTAAATWGQTAKWCDYSGKISGQPAGITLIPGTANFRDSWWHNRDYGVFVANPFGRAAMKQGEKSSVKVERGDSFRIRFAAIVHEGAHYDPAAEFAAVTKLLGANLP